MGKKDKIKILEALQMKDKNSENLSSLVFKVQIAKGAEPVTMFYDQIKYCYPQALIDFYESQSELLKKEESSESLEQSEESSCNLLDYDTQFFANGSRILEYINSLRVCVKGESIKDGGAECYRDVKVYEQETAFFYLNFISKAGSKMDLIEEENFKEYKIKIQ